MVSPVASNIASKNASKNPAVRTSNNLDHTSASNQPLIPSTLVPLITSASAPSPRMSPTVGFKNITVDADFRKITFFEPGAPISRALQKQHTEAVLSHIKHLFVQTPSPMIILGAAYMNARGVQLAHYLKQIGLPVCVDGFAQLTQFYQRNHTDIQKLVPTLTNFITHERALIYFGEPHLVHKMVATGHDFIQGIEQAWQKGSLTIIGEQHAVFSAEQQTFSSSAQRVVDELLKGCEQKDEKSDEKNCESMSLIPVKQLSAHQTTTLFKAVTHSIHQSRNWPEALATIFVLLNHLPTPHGSALFDVGSESLSLLNKLCEMNSAPDFSATALRSLLQGAIGDALSNLKELVNYVGERDSMHPILPVVVMGDTAFVNGGGQHMMLKLAEHMQKAFVTVFVLNNHQQKIENSIAAAPVKGHHNGQHVTDGRCVYRVDNLTALKQALLEYVVKLKAVMKGASVPNMLLDVDLTPNSQLISLAKPISVLNADTVRVKNLNHIIELVFSGFSQKDLHGYACSFFELVHEITRVESKTPAFHYHATLTDQGVFASLAFHVATAFENAQQIKTETQQRYARLIFMNSCFPVRLPDQIPKILNAPVSPLLPIFVVADTPHQATSPYAMGLPHREFLTTTVPVEKTFQAASQLEGDIQFVNTEDDGWTVAFAQALQDPHIKLLVVRM